MSDQHRPKLELHLHLEGAAPPEFVRRLAGEQGLSLDGVFDQDGAYQYRDFGEFLSVYEAATAGLTSPEAYGRLTREVMHQLADHGVIYAETFVSPDFCGGRDVSAWRDYLAAIIEAADQVEAERGVTLRGIVTAIRHFGPDKARETALCAAETAGNWIVGFGIAGDENVLDPVDFAYSFDMAREAKLGLTAHAGEWRGPDHIMATVRDLGVDRIGHGVRAIEDPACVDFLAERGIVLEVCPGSNVALGVYPKWADHPIEKLRAAGVRVTVSTDDPPFFHTTMTAEYENLRQHFGWDQPQFDQIDATALEAAYCDADTKARLKQKLEVS
ncbi:adenosine deaminase [Algirhabdus cladophorae]|uniref:adenosine deaminase n=1 Tax=Algirhabdus cladophorae TaxID=3377108 RepID=UPI003B846552